MVFGIAYYEYNNGDCKYSKLVYDITLSNQNSQFNQLCNQWVYFNSAKYRINNLTHKYLLS